MAKHGKKYLAAVAKVDQNKNYAPAEALALVKETSITKFDGTVEVHLRLGVDPRQSDQQVRGVCLMPGGLGKTVRILVFAEGEGARAAQDAGADYIIELGPEGGEEGGFLMYQGPLSSILTRKDSITGHYLKKYNKNT